MHQFTGYFVEKEIEKAYRKGYSHGFNFGCVSPIENKNKIADEIDEWVNDLNNQKGAPGSPYSEEQIRWKYDMGDVA